MSVVAMTSKGDKALQTVSKHNPTGKLQEAVFKATQSKEEPSKHKHIRTCVNETWVNPSRVFDEILKRPLAEKEIALYKSLVLVFHLLREGHPQALAEAARRENLFTSWGDLYKTASTDYGPVIAGFVQLLINKIQFHKTFPELKGDINLQDYKHKANRNDPKTKFSLVAKLLDLQKNCMVFQQKVFQTQNLKSCKLSGIIPTIKEAYAIYHLTVALLQDLVDSTDNVAVNSLIDNFYQQYPVLYKFFFTSASIPYLTQHLSIPTLPRDPPNFVKKPELPPAKLPQKTVPPKKAAPKPAPPSTPKPTATVTTTYYTPPPPQLDFTSTIQGIGQITGDLLTFGFPEPAKPTPQMVPVNPFMTTPVNKPAPTFQPAPQSSPNPFMTNPSGLNGSGLSNVVQGAHTTYYPTVEPERFMAPPPPKPVDPSETREFLEAKIYELEGKQSKLAMDLKLLKGDHGKLLAELNNTDEGLAEARQEMEERLQTQQLEFLTEQKMIKDHLELTSKKYADEKLKLLSDQVGFSKNAVDQYLLRFDDPNFLGNRSATGEDVVDATYKIQESFDMLVTTLAEEGDIVGAARVLAADTEAFLANVKGLSNRVDDPELKLRLGEGARNAARMVSKILADTQALSVQGKPSEATLDNLRSTQNTFEQQLGGVRSAINNQASKSQKEEDNHLNDVAERELMNAAKVIEEAAEQLKAQAAARKAQRALQQFSPGEIDVEGAIADSALYITTATQKLIIAATAAQQERVAMGLTAPAGSDMYHSDEMWAEGLISAAKAVASATKLLVGSANKAISGEIDEALLVACCNAVSAHTAKLQSATKSKSDVRSKSVQGVDGAAKLVKEATNSLVNETKKVAFSKDQVGGPQTGSEFGNIKAVMELEGNIGRLRDQIRKANDDLYAHRKEGYDQSRAQAPIKAGPVDTKPVNASSPTASNPGIDTTSIANPFGGSFRDKDHDVVLPSYQAKKTDAVPLSSGKIDLSNKPPLEVKSRPLHLQTDLNANFPVPPPSNSYAAATLPPPPASSLPPASNPFGANIAFPPPPATNAGATTMPPPPTNVNPFLTNPSNPFM